MFPPLSGKSMGPGKKSPELKMPLPPQERAYKGTRIKDVLLTPCKPIPCPSQEVLNKEQGSSSDLSSSHFMPSQVSPMALLKHSLYSGGTVPDSHRIPY